MLASRINFFIALQISYPWQGGSLNMYTYCHAKDIKHKCHPFQVKFTSAAILPAVPTHPRKHCVHEDLYRVLQKSGGGVFLDAYLNFIWRGAVLLLKMSGERRRGIIILRIEKNCWWKKIFCGSNGEILCFDSARRSF